MGVPSINRSTHRKRVKVLPMFRGPWCRLFTLQVSGVPEKEAQRTDPSPFEKSLRGRLESNREFSRYTGGDSMSDLSCRLLLITTSD